MDYKLLKNELACIYCKILCAFRNYKKSPDEYGWRCLNKGCKKYKFYYSIRKESFFEGFSCNIREIMKILIKYVSMQPRYSIKSSVDVSNSLVVKVLNKLLNLVPVTDFSANKLGGPVNIVQIDETMLNFKVKSHRGRAPLNKTDALCIIELNSFRNRAFATILPDKKSSTILPIILSQVAENSVIWTDEFKSYANLTNLGFRHKTICHKYEFINSETGVNTQTVESFNNELKLEIKRRKGVKTEQREIFLKEFCFLHNNKLRLLDAVLELIKI